MRRILSALMGLAIAVLVVGVTLVPLTQPFFTQVLAGRFALAQEAGLPPARMFEVAEQVRFFVVDPAESTLPQVVDGRSGFDPSAVSHLADVRAVIAGAQVVTWGLMVLVAVWLWFELSRQRADRVAAALRASALWCAALVVLALAAGLSDFEALFSAFHGLFFAAGTWTFSSDSLLIQTFPEPFWATAAAVWAGLIVLSAVVLWLAARALMRSSKGSPTDVAEASSAKGA